MGYFKEMLSENGVASSKRFVGFISYLVCLACVIGLVIKDGGTTIVEGLIQTILVTATSLLGISSVTGIWKGNNKVSIDGDEEETKKRKEKRHKKVSKEVEELEGELD